MIKVTNLNKFYNKGKDNELHVINNISLELPSTGLVSFLGQSGSGKTTLLNVIGGLDKGTGEIEYDDKKIKNYNMKQVDSFRRKEFGYVFQNYNLLLSETVYDNLVLALEMIDIYDKEEQSKRIEYVLKMVGMYKYRKKKAFALSGGQQQRISIARALVKESKVIIADEPTGNLDSENSIQVMNILKKISKTTLVLMVTHNEDLANFYSDLIYRIKDGEIIKREEISTDATLSQKESNVIYKKDLTESIDESALTKVNYYSEGKPKQITLEIIEHNGTFYLKSDENIKLLEQSNLRVLDKHYEELKKEDIDTFEYDTSFFSKGKDKRKRFSEFKLYTKQSYHSISTMKKKTKFLYASFFIIGILFAIAVCAFTNFTVVNTKNFAVDDEYYTVHSDDYYSSNEETISIRQALNNNSIKNVNRIMTLIGTYKNYINYNEQIEIQIDFPIISTLNHDRKILKGKAPQGMEIMLSKGTAEELISKSIDELIGIKVFIQNGYITSPEEVKISGINDNPYCMTYLDDELYCKYISMDHEQSFLTSLVRSYAIESKNNTYEIVKGRDLNKADLNTDNILIPDTFPNALELVNENVHIDGSYTVVGVYKMKGLKNYYNEYIRNIETPIIYEDQKKSSPINYSDYYLVDGKIPSSNNEIIASIYSKYSIGDKVEDYVVVGLFTSNINQIADLIFTRDSYALNSSIYSKCVFDVVNMGNLLNSLKQKYTIKNWYENNYDITRQEQNVSLAIFGSFAGILVIVLVIFIYFLMRSRMISEIYPIGVYRSLGASKGRIYNKFICDIFVTTSLTAIIGYLGFMILYGTVANTTNSLLDGVVLMNSIPMTLIGIVILYLLSFIFGLLPIQGLLRKTPAEILAKYDI